MKLFLTSSTITPNLIKPFEAFIGKSSVGLRAAFIPDAGLKTSGDKAWIDEEMQQDLIEGLRWNADKITLAEETYESLQKLFDYDVIYVNGGYSGYLAQVMRQSGFEKLLPELLKKDIVYVGSSAGSMVLSKVQDAASIYFGEPEPEALEIGGLGLIDFEFYPMHDHRWTEDLVEKIKAKRNETLKYYLVRDGQAVSVERTTIQTHGDVITLNAIPSASVG
jgi:dipeptidase E